MRGIQFKREREKREINKQLDKIWKIKACIHSFITILSKVRKSFLNVLLCLINRRNGRGNFS